MEAYKGGGFLSPCPPCPLRFLLSSPFLGIEHDHPREQPWPEASVYLPPKVKGPSVDIEENGVTAIMLSTWQTSSVGTWPNSHSPDPPLDTCPTLEPKQPPTAVSGASDGCNSSFESLKHALSSRSGRELLRALPTDRAIGVIDVLEQVSAKRLGCIVTS